MKKKILDVTCGSRSIWFNKNHPDALYCDIKKAEYTKRFGANNAERHAVVDPDIQCSFTDLPFDDNSFSLVVFDPPHMIGENENSWMRKLYGYLTGDWKTDLKKGFDECMRVLKPDGVLIFKWAETSISTREIIDLFGKDPLFGHRSGKKSGTHWLCYMKE